MSFNGLQLRFIRFLGTGKEPAEFKFESGLNILWGSSDTGKTFLVSAIDYMLGSGTLKDIPQRVGYDHVLLGLTVASGQDYTLHRSTNGGSFRRFDGLLTETPKEKKAGKTLSAIHTTKNYNNLSHWLLQQIGLDNKDILFNGTTGETQNARVPRPGPSLCHPLSKDHAGIVSALPRPISRLRPRIWSFQAPPDRQRRFCDYARNRGGPSSGASAASARGSARSP